jgi:O-antigen/teichoic acid export membrane protein
MDGIMLAMRALFGRLGRQAIVYGAGGGALQIVGLLTLPIYARVFRPAQYGVLEVVMVGFAAVLLLVDTGMISAAQRSFYDYSDDQTAQRRAALVTGLTITMSLSLAVAGAMTVLADPISSALFGTAAHADLVQIVGWTVPLATLATYMREVMRLRFHASRYVASSLVGAIGAAVTGVLAVTAFGAGISGVLLGLLVGNALAALYGIAAAGGDLVGRFSIPELHRMMRYGGPLIPASFALWGLAFLDRVMLSQLSGFSETGQYGVGSRYAMVLMFCLTTFLTAYGPFMLSLWQDDPEAERQVRARLLSYITLGLVAAGLVLSLFARELTAILAPRFDRSYQVVGVLSIGIVLFAIASVASMSIGLTRRTAYIGAYTVLATLVNVGLNLLLIPRWGMIGAATATASAYGLLALLFYRKAQQLVRTPYLAGRVLKVLLVGCPLMGVGALPIHPVGLALAIKLLTLCIFALLVWRLGLVDEEELDVLRSLTRRLRSRLPASTPAH